ncbi:MAG: sulfate adenylyltransferase subunit CysD [Planctomycetes bacterium]|nr:sulfate adenylyltransferase subunit CysD [Planctomycetota bacterium]NBY00683.1 sulfate adenylyltransferase subunit CysD [Planctomycetota bacterium]
MESNNHLRQLEAEAIHVFREVAESFERPVLLYSIGKDSSVMLHLALKAFFPGKPPFPLLHIDSTWEFREMIEFRENHVRGELGMQVIVHTNKEGERAGINPFDFGSRIYTEMMRTKPLREALEIHRFDAAIGGGRRDEEPSRSKERIFSFRDRNHRWDPRNQRPELWNLFNTKIKRGESMRIFPLSNWTEMDVWEYIRMENIRLVPLYFSAARPVVRREDDLIMVDDDRMRLHPGEIPEIQQVRFRTLGCYPVTGATLSTARNVTDIIEELKNTRFSERRGRAIDRDEESAMERKKRDGYF